MEHVFLRVVSLSLSAGWLVLAVLLIRAVMRRAPRRILCLLWALVAVRLACPVSIPSPVSLVPNTETVVQSVQDLTGSAVSAAVPAPEQSARAAVQVFSRVWLAGAAAMLLWALWGDVRLRRRVRVFLPLRRHVRVCEEIDTPFVLGVVHPKVYLPAGLNPADLEHVLKHEAAHIARRDHWWKPLGWLLLSVYWFQPLLWAAYVLFCRDLELACDERVAEGLDRPGLAAYSEALLRCSRVRRGSMALPVAFGEVGVKTRVQAILRYRKPGLRLVVLALAAVLAVSVLFLTERPAAAAQLQALWQDVNEDAWTIQLPAHVEGAPDPAPPSAEPSPSPSAAVQPPQPTATNTNSAAPRTAGQSAAVSVPTPSIPAAAQPAQTTPSAASASDSAGAQVTDPIHAAVSQQLAQPDVEPAAPRYGDATAIELFP